MHTLLSEHWHAVRHLRPRLREGVEVLHRRLRGKPWVLLFDPVSQRFHRAPPAVHRILRLMDGRRTLDEIWLAAGASGRIEDGQDDPLAIGQPELVQLVATLHGNDLLQSQVAPDAAEVFERHRRQERSRQRQSWMNPLSIRVPLLYPDRWFDHQAPFARRLFTRPVLLLWLALVAPAALLAWQHWPGLTDNLADRVLTASNVALLWLTYPVVKALHEWAHGLAVKAWGGRVREIGLMFVFFTPVPYVDATSSYRFPSKWARAAVAAAGILTELALGALAVYVWLLSQSGLVSAIAFNVVLIAGVSTLVVNGNPLMRYDGYFVLCDLLETPNLSQRAAQYWTYLADRYAFGSADAHPPPGAQDERWLLLAYGAVAPVYRLMVSIGLIWFIAGEYPMVGMVLALAAAVSAFVLPLWRGWKHLRESPALGRRREAAMRRTLLALGCVAAMLALVPLPFHSVHQAVVWVPQEAVVRAPEAGHVAAAVHPGEAVGAGQPLLTLDNPALDAQTESARGALEQALAQLRRAEREDLVKAESLRSETRASAARLADLEARSAERVITARTGGQWASAAATELVGRYAKRGELLGHVVAGPSDRIRVAVAQEDMALIRDRLDGIDVRLGSAPREPIRARLGREVPGGEFTLVSSALGTRGGGDIPVDPSTPEGTRPLRRVFDLELVLARPVPTTAFGDRAHVRFELAWTPLGMQWMLRLRQLFLSRLHV
jgi:putative peptide zinc metalloprotease protein